MVSISTRTKIFFRTKNLGSTIPTSNLKISNIRLFKTMIKEEQHDFILSQQFIKDESMLLLIDNCRPQVKVPFITRNR